MPVSGDFLRIAYFQQARQEHIRPLCLQKCHGVPDAARFQSVIAIQHGNVLT